MALLLPVTGGVASAQPSGPTIDGPSVVAASPDFATEEFGDPWDFSNPEDVQTDNEGPVLPASARASLGGGRLLVDAPEGFLIALVWAGISGTIPVGREGQLHAVAAGRYTHAAVRVRAPSKDIPLGVLFHNCPSGAASCAGDEGGFTVPGWQTFIIDLSRDPEWAGSIESLRLQTGRPAGDERFEVDWVRLYAPTEGVTVHADNGAEVFWDLDTDPSNNTAEERNWGSVGTATGGQVTFPAPTPAASPP